MDQDRRGEPARPLPDTRQELASWVRETIGLPDHLHDLLLAAVDRIVVRHEQLWQASKEDAIHAVSQGFADKLARLKHQLAAKDATVSNISEYFENLVSNLSEKAGRDAKTNLLNFPRFEEALTILLATERRVNRCAVGLIDIARFKWYNDTCGHLVGDQIIERVSVLLRQHMRDQDLVAKEADTDHRTMHARFGGDEFCFLIPDLDEYRAAWVIAERFREAVERHDWTSDDPRLAEKPVRVDVGIVCLMLSDVAERRPIARQLAQELLERADKLMYEAKQKRADHIHPLSVRIENGMLVELEEHPA